MEGARDLNPAMASAGQGTDELGSAVMDARTTVIVKVPVEKLAQVIAAQLLAKAVAACNSPATGGRVDDLLARCLPLLQLEAGLRDLRGKLRPDSRYQLSVSLDNLSSAEAVKSSEKAQERWNSVGQRDLLAAATDARLEYQRTAALRAAEFNNAAATNVHSAPEFAALLRELLLKLDDRLAAFRQQSEGLAAHDTVAFVKS